MEAEGFANEGILVMRFNVNGNYTNDFTAPYALDFSNLPIGDHVIFLQMRDSASTLPRIFSDEITITIAAALPVELTKFAGSVVEESYLLYWQTSSELNNEKFEIEESLDGRTFQKIGEVKGNGTSSEQHDYHFKVENPKEGISYYQLKQVDFDGGFEHSNIINLSYQKICPLETSIQIQVNQESLI